MNLFVLHVGFTCLVSMEKDIHKNEIKKKIVHWILGYKLYIQFYHSYILAFILVCFNFPVIRVILFLF